MLADAIAGLPRALAAVWGAAFGLCVGSFLNVVAHRVPRGASLLERSRCPRCEAPIRWRDNIPVLSYLLLGGRCRDCGGAIAVRYPIVETLTGVLWGLAAWRFGPTPAALAAAVFAAILLALALIDLDHMALPDSMTAALLGLGALASVSGVGPAPREAALAAAGAAGFFGAVAVLTRGGMGAGDVLLAAGLGANLGPWRTALAVWIAALAGGATACWLLATRRVRRGEPIPYGPFLSLGGIAAALAG